MMADTGFLKGLVEFDKDSLSEKQVQLIAKTDKLLARFLRSRFASTYLLSWLHVYLLEKLAVLHRK